MPERPNRASPRRSAAARREDVLRAAFEVFVAKGFEASTTREIAARARTSKRALYEAFAGKRALLDALIRAGAAPMQPPPDQPPPSDRAEFVATLERMGAAFLAAFLDARRLALYRLAIAEAGAGGREIAQALDAGGRTPVAAAFTGYFAAAAARGMLDAGAVPQLVQVYFGVLLGFAPLQILLGNEPPPDGAAIAARATLAADVVARLADPRARPVPSPA